MISGGNSFAARRRGVARGAFFALALALAALGCAPQARAARDDSAAEGLGWRLGPQAYTFRNVTLYEAIDKTQALGMKYIELYPNQKLRPDGDVRSGVNMSAEDLAALKRKLADAGITPVCFGVTGIPKEEAAARKLFQFARDLGIETITSEPEPEALEAIDKLCGEYGVNVAIHNHPKPSRYWDPDVLLAAVQGRSRRIGACADIGHWMRSGVNPLEALRKLEGRIISFHFKDLNEFGVRGAHDVPWGTGVSDTRALLAEIRRQGFNGVFSIEYEHEPASPQLADNVGQCVAAFDRFAADLAAQTPAETGAVSLFNGKDLSGWTWSSDAVKDTWSVRDGVVVNAGKPNGYIRTEKDYTNFVLRLQFRHVTKGNSGVLVRMTGPDKVWPRSLECQGQAGAVGDIWNIDNVPMNADPARTNGRRTAKFHPSSERPLGEWNTYDITMDGSELIVKVNGVLQNSASGCEVIPGKICLQSEGGQLEFRNIRVIPLPGR